MLQHLSLVCWSVDVCFVARWRTFGQRYQRHRRKNQLGETVSTTSQNSSTTSCTAANLRNHSNYTGHFILIVITNRNKLLFYRKPSELTLYWTDAYLWLQLPSEQFIQYISLSLRSITPDDDISVGYCPCALLISEKLVQSELKSLFCSWHRRWSGKQWRRFWSGWYFCDIFFSSIRYIQIQGRHSVTTLYITCATHQSGLFIPQIPTQQGHQIKY